MSSSRDHLARSDAWVPEQRTRGAEVLAPAVPPARVPTEDDVNEAIAAVIRCWLAEDRS